MPQEPRRAGGCIVSRPWGASGVVGALWCIVGGLNAVRAPEELHTFQEPGREQKAPEAVKPRGVLSFLAVFYIYSAR